MYYADVGYLKISRIQNINHNNYSMFHTCALKITTDNKSMTNNIYYMYMYNLLLQTLQ